MKQSRCILWFGVLAVLVAVAARADYTRVNAPNPNDPMDAVIYRLDNGLTVYLTENHESPRFYAEIAVRAGSKQDPAESTGLAHYLEHLLFKGSDRLGTLDYARERVYLDYIAELYELLFREHHPQRRAALYAQINEASRHAAAYAVPNELDRLYSGMGASGLNAHTSHEETVYKVELPANRLRHWAALESDRFAGPVFRLFQTELETVFEEVNRAFDNKRFIIYRAVQRQLFKNHPYGQQPTIGLPEHIKNPSLRNIGKYYAAHYVPNNMAIFISGDIDAEETIEIIDQHFSAWRPGDLPEPQTWEEPPLAGREYVECSYEGEEYALLAFRTVPRSHPDAEALLVFDMVLDNAMAGLINLNLNQRQRVRQAGAFPGQMNDYGAQYFWGVPKDGQPLEEVEALLLEQIELVKRGEFEDWILAAILNDFKKRVKGGLEDNAARAGMMRESFIAFEEWDHTVAQLDRIEKVTREDVMRVAAAYFSGGYVAGFRKDAPHQPPYYDKPDLAAIDIDPNRESEFGKRIAALPSAAVEPVFVDPVRDYTKTADESGVTLYHVPNRINDLFSFSISVDIGRRQDDRIGVATALLEKAGTDRLDPEALRKEWYRLGTDFAVVAGDDETTVSISGLDEQFDASLALLVECLTAPISDDATLETLKRNLLKSREDAQKQPDTLMRALFLHHRYGEESPYLRRLPGPAVEALALDELLGLIRGLARYRRTVFYTGSLPLEAVQAALARHCPVKGPLDAPPPYTFLRAKAPERSEIAFVHREMGQAHIRIEFGDVEFDETLTPASQLFNEYFGGGMAGVVFQELREARALAYSAGARYIPGNRLGDQNLMIGGIETQADKTVEAVSTFIDLFDALPPSPERFALAKESLINLYRTGKVGFRQVAGVVRSWERLGLAPDPRAQRYPVILASSLDDLLRFHQQHIGDKPKLISIVGDRAKIDMDRLGALAPVTELTADQLFTP